MEADKNLESTEIKADGDTLIIDSKKKDTKSLIIKIANITVDVILVLFVAFAVFSLVIAISTRNEDGSATIFGTQLRFVKSDSMAECEYTDVSNYKIKSIPVKSCVFIETVPEDENEKQQWYSNVEVGDVLTFRYYIVSKQETITHRVVKIDANEAGGYIFTLEGDNKSSKDGVSQQIINTSEKDSFNYVIGKVTGQNYALGLVIYSLHQPVGIALIVIVPCVIIIIYSVYRIIHVLRLDKKEKLAVETNQRNEEIELLKQQIAELKKSDLNKQKSEKEDE